MTFVRSRTTTARRFRFVVAGSMVALWVGLAIVACSDSKPDPAGNPSGGDAAGGDSQRADGSVADAADAAADSDTAVDAGADADAQPVHCFGDNLETEDGGDAGDPDAGDAGLDCAGVTAACTPVCEHVIAHYRAGVAQKAIRCMRALPSCNDPLEGRPCVDQALILACAAPSSPAYCAPLHAACTDDMGDASPGEDTLSKLGCEQFGNALNADGRNIFADCVLASSPDGGCPLGVVTCADDIRQ